MKPWIAIIAFPHPKPTGTRPYVLQDDELENVATFSTVEEIREIKERHRLGDGEWTAFNYLSSNTVEL